MRRALIAGGVVAFCLGGIAALYYEESRKILSQPVTAWTTDHRADCAIVLTGGPGRVREGFDLLAQKRVKKLIISGVYQHSELRDIFPQWPYYGPMKKEDVVLEKRSLTTFGNAQQSLALVEALRCRDVVLVTSRLHMYRSLLIFKSAFPAEIPIYPRAIVSARLKPEWIEVAVETTKSLFYRLWAY